jgi:hypothetical protein
MGIADRTVVEKIFNHISDPDEEYGRCIARLIADDPQKASFPLIRPQYKDATVEKPPHIPSRQKLLYDLAAISVPDMYSILQAEEGKSASHIIGAISTFVNSRRALRSDERLGR